MDDDRLTHRQDLSGMRSRAGKLGFARWIALSLIGGVLSALFCLVVLDLPASPAIGAGVAMVLAVGFVLVITLVEFDDGDIHRLSREAGEDAGPPR